MPIYKMSMEEVRCGGDSPGLEPSIPMIQEVWASHAHPFNPEGITIAMGNEQSTWEDYGMRWDNSGKFGDHATLNWSNA
jgi:hypothetical protein